MSSRATPQRKRVPWQRMRYGVTVKPHNEQMSNLNLATEQVMQRRHDPVRKNGSSRHAGVDTGKGISQ